MSILIYWNERNPYSAVHRVYRSTSPLDTGALPAPIATTPFGQTFYSDGDVAPDTLYYYLVEAVFGGYGGYFTSQISVQNTDPDAGGGGDAPEVGDYWADEGGWYGGLFTDQDGTERHLVIADVSSESSYSPYSNAGVSGEGPSAYDGASNTQTMPGGFGTMRGDLDGYQGSEGFSDWYIPAEQELAFLADSFQPDSLLGGPFATGGSQAFSPVPYKSSTEVSATHFSCIDFSSSGGFLAAEDKSSPNINYRQRAIRTVAASSGGDQPGGGGDIPLQMG